MTEPVKPGQTMSEGEARAALIERLSQVRATPSLALAAKSLQPTPEAAKSRLTRLRRRQRIYQQESKRVLRSELSTIPPAPDPLAP